MLDRLHSHVIAFFAFKSDFMFWAFNTKGYSSE